MRVEWWCKHGYSEIEAGRFHSSFGFINPASFESHPPPTPSTSSSTARPTRSRYSGVSSGEVKPVRPRVAQQHELLLPRRERPDRPFEEQVRAPRRSRQRTNRRVTQWVGEESRFNDANPTRESWSYTYADRRMIKPTLLRLIFPRFDHLPTDNRTILRGFVPPPESFAVPTRDAPPRPTRFTSTTGTTGNASGRSGRSRSDCGRQ